METSRFAEAKNSKKIHIVSGSDQTHCHLVVCREFPQSEASVFDVCSTCLSIARQLGEAEKVGPTLRTVRLR